MTAVLQDFSLCAGNTALLTVTVDTSIPMDTLAGSTIWWKVFDQSTGVAFGSAIIVKTNESGGGGLDILESPDMTFTIQLDGTDTSSLATGNYYHEGVVIDSSGDGVTVLAGIMTVTQALIAA